MHLKGALHVHTTCSDGTLSIKEALEAHEAQGFDFMALTDHDFLMRKGCYDAVSRLRTDMIIFLGEEIMFHEKGYIHINRVQGDREVLHVFNHPSELALSLPQTIERIRAVSEKLRLDAMEITTRGFYTGEFDVPEIRLSKIATDDSHERHMIGRAWVEMDAPRDKDAILRAIKNGDFWNCFASKRTK